MYVQMQPLSTLELSALLQCVSCGLLHNALILCAENSISSRDSEDDSNDSAGDDSEEDDEDD